MVKTGTHLPPGFAHRIDSVAKASEVNIKGEISMQNAIVLAFVTVAVAPLVGIWRGHVWAKKNGMVLRTDVSVPTVAPGATSQVA